MRLAVWLLGIGLLSTVFAAGALAAGESKSNQEFAQKATWKVPAPQSVHADALEWLSTREADAATRAQVDAMWAAALDDGHATSVFDALCGTLAAGDPKAGRLVAACSRPRVGVALPDIGWLADENLPALERHNLRLHYARWLVHEALYDEASAQLAELRPENVADPAALLFYQAIVYHRMLAREPGLTAIGRLLENEAAIPKRFVSLARLMQADLEPLKEESLDHIARRMDDIRRRLDLGRAGPKVRAVEDGVIASLDKLIKQLEEQQQAAAAAAAAQSRGGAQPSNPLPDSMPMEQKGAGEVAKKPIGNSSGWGNLPAKDRQEALQQIGNDFPAHYRDMIEQYFRKLAAPDGEKNEK
jgi:hypothetical protein